MGSKEIVEEAPTVAPKVALSVFVTPEPGTQVFGDQLSESFQIPLTAPDHVSRLGQLEYPIQGKAVRKTKEKAFLILTYM